MKIAKRFLKLKARKRNIKAQFMDLVGSILPIAQNVERNVMNTSLFQVQKRNQNCQVVDAVVAVFNFFKI